MKKKTKKSNSIKDLIINALKKVSIFDFIILFLLMALGLSFFLFFFRKSEYITIKVKVTNQDILYEYSKPNFLYTEQFIVGDVERDSLGNIVSEITNVEKFPVDDDKQAVFVELKVRATYDTRSKLYSSRGQSVVYGAPVRFSLSNVTFDGFITDFQGKQLSSSSNKVELKVTIKDRVVEKEVASAFKVGETVTDSIGNKVMEVKKINISDSDTVIVDSFAYIGINRHSSTKSMIMDLLVTADKVGNSYFIYGDTPLLVGKFFPLVINNKLLDEAIIIGVEEIEQN